MTGMGVMEVMLSSCNNLLSQESLAVSYLRLRYSASAEERERVTYFLDFQEIKVLPRKITKPLTDLRLWGQEAQSTS